MTTIEEPCVSESPPSGQDLREKAAEGMANHSRHLLQSPNDLVELIGDLPDALFRKHLRAI